MIHLVRRSLAYVMTSEVAVPDNNAGQVRIFRMGIYCSSDASPIKARTNKLGFANERCNILCRLATLETETAAFGGVSTDFLSKCLNPASRSACSAWELI